MTLTTPRRLTALTLGAAALALAPATASAATTSIAGGGTTLSLDPAAAKALTDLGVGVAPTGPATSSTDGITFPVTTGRLGPKRSVIRHTGGLRLKAGKTKVTLSDFVVRINKRASISAKVNGGPRLKAFYPTLGKAKFERSGLDTVISPVGVRLSTKAAKALNGIFGTTAFAGGLRLGSATIKATPRAVRFTGGQTDLALDQGAADALASLHITPGLVEGATANDDGSFAFPVTGGKANVKTLAGHVDHSGGISLTRDATTVTLTDFVINTGDAVLTAKINGGSRAAILSLDLSAPDVSVDGTTLTVGNVTGRLTGGAADALNQAFGTTAFAEGLVIGVATLRGETA